ncbi:MAG TPA: 50S ribosomal protein L10 [Fimbriimonadales bacterium]|nr:50S ribosomal protein L10 [Fimbriimonadales bacterium]
MPTPKKIETVEKAKNWYSQSKGLIFTEYSGLSVPELQQLRSSLRETGGEFHVIKNTLLRIALGSDVVEKLPPEFHNGVTATLFVFDNEVNCAKVLTNFAKTNKKLKIKGAFLEDTILSAKEVDEFAKLPPREELIASIAGAITATLSQIAGCIQEMLAGPIRAIGAVADKLGASQTVSQEGTPSEETKTEETKTEEEKPAEDTTTTTENVSEAEATSEKPTESKEE